MNCPNFELLSAYADGETTPAEAALVNRHRTDCAACEQQLANLGMVSREVRKPQALPTGFKIEVKPRARRGWWQSLRELAESPVAHLVSAQRRRRARFGLKEIFKIMAVFALPVFFMSISSDRSSLIAFLMVSAFGLMVGLPLRQFSEEVALLASLRRGRCLEEIVTSGTSPQALLDGLALQGLLQIGRATATVWPVLLLGTLALPSHWQSITWELEISWLLSLLGIFLAGYYAAQLFQVWPGNWLRRSTMLLMVLSPWTLLLVGLPGCLAASALTAIVARRLAIHGLKHPAVSRALPLTRRNPLVRTWSENPIARREISRLASGLGGLPKLVAWRASMAILPIAWTLHSIDQPLARWPAVFYPGILMFATLFFLRSATLTLPAVVREREQQSWEILMQTPLGPRMVILGWLQVCLYSLFSEGLFALVVLTGYLLAAAPWSQWGGPLAGLLLLPMASGTGASVGLALSASSRTQREAGQRLIFWSLSAGLGWLVAWGLGQGLQSMLGAPLVAFKDSPTPFNLLGPMAVSAAFLVALLLALKARPLLSKLPCIDPGQAEEVGRRYSPVLFCLDLGSLLALGYSLAAWDVLARQADLPASQGATLLLAGGLVWLLGLRLPLATLAELSLGSRFSLVLGAALGLWLSWAAYLALQAVSFQLKQPLLGGVEAEYLCMLLGLLAGGFSGALAWRAPLTALTRSLQLRPRLLRSGALSLAGLLAAFGAYSRLEIPRIEQTYQPPSRSSRYRAQLEVAEKITRSLWEDERLVPPSSNSPEKDWKQFALDNVQSPALRHLRQQLPQFGSAAQVPGEVNYLPQSWNRLLCPLLRAQSILSAHSGNAQAALNCDRWALLCLDGQEHWSTRTSPVLNDEVQLSWVLENLKLRISQGLVAPGLIEQLLNHEAASTWLSYSYMENYPAPWPQLLPRFYLEREERATNLSTRRAQGLAREFKLWELSHDGGAELLEGNRFVPLTRNKIYRLTVSNGVRGLARSWTRREGLALLAAIQLYRRDHGQAWPDDLEQAKSYLPRPARCYLNQSGSFDYAPGILSCSRDDGSERIIIYQEGKR